MAGFLIFIVGVSIFYSWYRGHLTNAGRMIAKGVMIYGLILLAILFVFGIVTSFIGVADAFHGQRTKTRLECIERHYYDAEFSDMREALRLYDCYEPEFDMFWEIAEADELYHKYVVYGNIIESKPEYKEKYEQEQKECYEKICDLKRKSEYTENIPFLENYIRSMN